MEISQPIHLLGRAISALESQKIFTIEERIRLAAKERRVHPRDAAAARLQAEFSALDPDQARAIAASFATYSIS